MLLSFYTFLSTTPSYPPFIPFFLNNNMKQKQELKRVGILSVFKICFVIGLVLGLVIGVIYAAIFGIIAMLGMSSGMEMENIGIAGAGIFIFVIAIVGIIFLALFYGIISGVFGALYAFIYNLTAKHIGGIEMEFTEKKE